MDQDSSQKPSPAQPAMPPESVSPSPLGVANPPDQTGQASTFPQQNTDNPQAQSGVDEDKTVPLPVTDAKKIEQQEAKAIDIHKPEPEMKQQNAAQESTQQQTPVQSAAAMDQQAGSKKIESEALKKLFFMNSPEAVSFVNEVIQEAVRLSASDIMFEPQNNRLRVRARIDGVLYEMGTISIDSYIPISSRIKVVSGLDPTEKRKIQEGQFDLIVDGKKINLRVEVAQIITGELIVIRIHERGTIVMDLKSLGMNNIVFNSYQQILRQRSGLVLVCGPTGSGKTTTLYSTLTELSARGDLNIITIENPVEFRLEGVNQMQTQPDIGFNFADGLRAVVRLSPDVVLVGEIRDQETASIAVESGLTGQLVFSTIHADDSIGALFRLLELGIETYFMNSALVGVVAQRLVRRICEGCRQQYSPNAEETEIFTNVLGREPKALYRGQGCPACGNLTYRGRVGLFEVLLVDATVRDFIRQKYNEDVFRKHVENSSFQTLLKDGLQKAESGLTTIEEVLANSLRAF